MRRSSSYAPAPAPMPAALVLLALLLGPGASSGGEDWLLGPRAAPARVEERAGGREIVLTNGLIARVFRTAPSFATVDLVNLEVGATLLRAVKPEAALEVDGRRFEVGGLKGQPDHAYLDRAWLDGMTCDPGAFQLVRWRTSEPAAPYPWTRRRHAPEAAWPPRGLRLTAELRPPDGAGLDGLTVSVHYEIYEGLPVIMKQLALRNGTSREVVVGAWETEILAVNEAEKSRLHVESDYAFSGVDTTSWGPDPEYLSQVDYHRRTPLLLTSRCPLGPGARVAPGEELESFRTFELLHASDDRERRGLARRRMYRLLAPQVTENPVLMHVRSSDSESIRRAVDQCAEAGFEMVIITFWSGFDMESEDPTYIARMKADFDYAHSRGIEIGGYTLMCASRDVGPEQSCISPETGKPGSKFGQSACLASEWADGYFRRVWRFIEATGLDVVETDGPYHGDVCASTRHAHHRGLADSQWRQWQACAGFYRECRRRGIYVHAPDWYYLNGSNRCAMGYREDNWSLPRERQIVIARQNIYDGTFEKTPSMGWMFVPLVEYHGGGAAATLEPLAEHLAEYEAHLAQNFGSGVQACYRGPRLFDGDRTKAVVQKWTRFYRRHREILDSDIVHVRRPDGRSADCMMHVNPRLKEKALAMVYNPTAERFEGEIELPLYYAGLSDQAMVRQEEGEPRSYALDREHRVRVPLALAPRSFTWLVVEGRSAGSGGDESPPR